MRDVICRIALFSYVVRPIALIMSVIEIVMIRRITILLKRNSRCHNTVQECMHNKISRYIYIYIYIYA